MTHRLYRLYNSHRNGAWVIASSIDHAKAIFMDRGYVKAIKNIKSVEDQTEFYLNADNAGGGTPELRQAQVDSLKALLDSNISGVAGISLGRPLTLKQVFGGARPTPIANVWEVM